MIKSQKAKPNKIIVIDSNVWISGLIFGGNPGLILKMFAQGDLTVVYSEELMSEIRRKIYRKFPLFAPKLELLEHSIRIDANLVKLGRETIKICRDEDDNKVIETAVLGNCQIIISGDKDLLTLKKYKKIKILAPTEFLLQYRE